MAGETWADMSLGDFVTLQRGHDLPRDSELLAESLSSVRSALRDGTMLRKPRGRASQLGGAALPSESSRTLRWITGRSIPPSTSSTFMGTTRGSPTTFL
jgi:hypothetical protein